MPAHRLNVLVFVLTLDGKEAVAEAGPACSTGRTARTDSISSWEDSSVIGLVGMDVWLLKLLPAADDSEK
jgi:hypothetical protein